MGRGLTPRALGLAGVALLAACGSAPAATPNQTAVARVRTTPITQAAFDVRLQSAFTAIQQGGGPTSNAAMRTGVRAGVLRSLILDTIIAQEASARGLAATDAEVQAQVNTDAQTAGGMSNLQTQLAAAGGSLAQLQDEIRSQLNEQRLENFFARQRADQTEQQLATGTDFASVAAQVSDDVNTNTRGGDLGALTAATLARDDANFSKAVRALSIGQYTTTPVHDQGGYDILLLYAKSAGSWSVRHILIAAPMPYTVTSRPTWFTEALFSTVQRLCQQNQIQVYITDAGANPCVVPPASPSPKATPRP